MEGKKNASVLLKLYWSYQEVSLNLFLNEVQSYVNFSNVSGLLCAMLSTHQPTFCLLQANSVNWIIFLVPLIYFVISASRKETLGAKKWTVKYGVFGVAFYINFSTIPMLSSTPL